MDSNVPCYTKLSDFTIKACYVQDTTTTTLDNTDSGKKCGDEQMHQVNEFLNFKLHVVMTYNVCLVYTFGYHPNKIQCFSHETIKQHGSKSMSHR